MALIDAVHIIGVSIYFNFFLLFVWLNRFPRTHHCAAWWAMAMLLQVSGRASFLAMDGHIDPQLLETLYASLMMLEKYFLIAGLLKLLDLGQPIPRLRVVTALALGWGLLTSLQTSTHWLFAIGLAVFNAGALFYVASVAYRHRSELPRGILWFTTVISVILGLHWLSYPVLRHDPVLEPPAFLLGMVYVALLYLSLIGALLLLFQKQLQDAEAQALEMAYQDPLTGLNNQRYMTKLFDEALLLARRPHQLVALLYIDLDNFKPINDGAGHQVGDEVLKTIARRLEQHTRSTDICARIGGDEFVVIATQLEDEQHVQDIAKKLLDELTRDIELGGVQYQVGASIGASIYPSHGESLDQLIEKADTAMYEAKKNGKSRFRLFSH